jgi:para-nitrobenzyl esterase
VPPDFSGAPSPRAGRRIKSYRPRRRGGSATTSRTGWAFQREAIAAVPAERLLAAQAELKAEILAHPDPERWGDEVVTSTLPWQPVVDGDVIPVPPINGIAAGAGGHVDVMVGTNSEDWRLFVVASGAIHRITEQILTGPVAVYGHQALAAYGLPVETALAAYRAAYPGASPGDLLAAVQTDWWCRVPAIRLAEAHATSPAATFMYEFAWRSPAFDGRLGACHALEIPFVFDTLDKGADQMVGPLLGPAPPQQLADTMHAAWVSFATSGDSGWPKYDLSRRATIRFDTTSEVVDDPRSVERKLWQGVR